MPGATSFCYLCTARLVALVAAALLFFYPALYPHLDDLSIAYFLLPC